MSVSWACSQTQVWRARTLNHQSLSPFALVLVVDTALLALRPPVVFPGERPVLAEHSNACVSTFMLNVIRRSEESDAERRAASERKLEAVRKAAIERDKQASPH